MALTPLPHGIKQTESPLGRVLLETPATAIWGIVATAPVVAGYPKGEAILVTDVQAAATALSAAGDHTAGKALQAIADFGRSIGVLVIVDAGVGEDAEDKAADQALKTIAGLQLLRSAEASIGVKPRIIAAPGLDAETVLTAMGVIAGQLNAFAYGAAQGETPAEIDAFRTGFGTRELMLIDADFTFGEEVSYATARAVGLRALLDRDVGYHKTISNVVIPGVTGVTVPRSWDLNSIDTEVGLINGADVTCIIRRDGFRFWGNRTCSADPRFVFESHVRTNAVLRDIIGQGLFPYIDQPLRESLALDIIESINALFRREKAAGRIMGGEAFLAESNTAETLNAGKLRIGYRFTAVAPLEDLGVNSEITDEFYADFAQLAAAA